MFIEFLKALLIGIVEGITEWLPISSTGHMILVDEFVHLDVSDQFLALFLVVIQIGAILAVIIMYWHKLNPFSSTKTADEKRATWHLWGMVVVGCIPAAIVGFALDDWVNEHFYNKVVVALALIAYGVVFILLERRNRERLDHAMRVYRRNARRRGESGSIERIDPDELVFDVTSVDDIDWKLALKIGLFQCLAIIPGTSRSGSTIIGGMLFGCSRTAAAEFTFFMAIPVMLGWGLVKAVKFILAGVAMTATEVGVLIIGVASAFIMSVVSIRFLMGYIKKNDFTIFGYYRIVIGIIVLLFFVLETVGILS